MDRVDYQSFIIQDIINLEKADELNLRPWYQRRSVWNPKQQSYLINTLLERKPVPALYIRHTLDLEKEKSIREVVDGQQRTQAIISYVKNEFKTRHPEHEKQVRFSDLTKQQRERFLLTAVPIGVLLGATDADVIDIFARINSVAKTLNAQEKRNAEFSGEFKQFCVKQATSRIGFWRDYGIFSGNDIARMLEVQFISDVVVNLMEGLSDFSSKLLDGFYRKYDDEFDKAGEIGTELDRIFDFIVSLDPSCVRDTIFSRQPIFFSLLVVLATMKRPSKVKVQEGLYNIDSRFYNLLPLSERAKEDVGFYTASSSTTQRISQRKIRHNYIAKHLS